MGSNRRYAHHHDKLMDQRIVDQVATSAGPLQSLTKAELELDTEPVTIDPSPKPVRAWVRFGATPALVDAEACRWTQRAMGIRFAAGGRQLHAWVWISAVSERPAR